MASQNITKTFNVNLHHEKPVDPPVDPPVGPTDPTNPTNPTNPINSTNGETQLAVPNTGFQQYISQPSNLILPGIILGACLLGIILLFISRKSKHDRAFVGVGSGCVALALGLAIPAICQFSAALEQANANTTTLDITVGEADQTATAIAQFTTDQDYPYGYIVSAYMTPNNALVNQAGTHSITSITTPSTLDQLSQNSWGISDVDAITYSPISTDATTPTQLYSTDDNTPAGTNIGITYGVKANNTLPEDTYTGIIHIVVDKKNPPAPHDTTFDNAFAGYGKTKDPATNLYKMQDMDTNICNAIKAPTSSTSGDEQTTTLVDTRDGKTYSVGKLADGNCWMTQNLTLGSTTSTTILTPANSDVAADYSLPQSSSSWTASDYSTPRIYYDAGNTGTSKDEVFYNFNAATAGTVDSSVTSGEATGSICPKGWKLPTGNFSGQFNTLYTAYSNNYNNMNTAFKFAFAGVFNLDDSQVSGQGNYGYWWSSTVKSDTESYLLLALSSGNVLPKFSIIRVFGFSVRCVSR